jgi:hypothetical protein
MRLRSYLLLSCMLVLTSCANSIPCNRSDISASYDAHGTAMTDRTTVTNQCWDWMLRNLDACYPKK